MTAPEQHPNHITLSTYAEKAYLEYAMSVVKGRAIPSLADGQKPVQRRILFAMNELGLTYLAKPVKSARVVGEVIANFHPHGDSSSYEAMVRMAQSFSLRYPLVDGVGNYGSRDGDTPAAMRYTEARLTANAELLLSEITAGTVDFVPNYDGVKKEPTVLPARLPMILLNGASGIAVGLATEIPAHNLTEVANACIALLKTPDLSLEELMHYIPGPDFAGGGQIITATTEIRQIYATGKGSLRVRACYEIEKLARGAWRVLVRELPQTTSAQKILAQIEEKTNPKTKIGKKQLSQEQLNTKALLLSALERVRDESDAQAPVRLVFEPKSSRQNPAEFMNILMAHTDLELNIAVNLIMIDLAGKPKQYALPEILNEWLIFRKNTLVRRLSRRLQQAEARAHILEGRMTVFIHLDAVIAVIREAAEPKSELMRRFELSANQAEDILEIRLRQLAKLEWLKLERELQNLVQEKTQLKHLLTDEPARIKLLITELEADSKKFGDARRTKIAAAPRSLLTQTAADEPVTLILSRQDWIRSRLGHNLDLAATTFKEGDGLKQILETRSVNPVILTDNQGQAYSIVPTDIPGGRGDGIPITALIDTNPRASLTKMIAANESRPVLIAASNGYGFLTTPADLASKTRAGKKILSLTPGAYALPPILVPQDKDNETKIVITTAEPRILAFSVDELKFMTKGKGLQLIAGAGAYPITNILLTGGTTFTLHLYNGKKTRKETYPLAGVLSSRGKKGKLYKTTDKITEVSAD